MTRTDSAHLEPKIPLGGGPGGVKRAVIAVAAAAASVAVAILLAASQTSGGAFMMLFCVVPLVINGVRRTFDPKLAPVLANKKDPAAIAEEADPLAIFAMVLSIACMILAYFTWSSGNPIALHYAAIFGPLGFAGVCFAMGQFSKAAAVRHRAQCDVDTMLAHAPREVPPSMESDGAAQFDRGGESR